ncbi:hypothetical protein HPB50_012805 [Hyalomma asiaticum]|uniref:Uncharacterized protein n=1 Tax=Hyalomma asiaticum TaxID=266040 RepID=A0ACB7RR12_HYAAI|nr:hypothetical protein HPB50_012805 [Hyalomma asiaticum]
MSRVPDDERRSIVDLSLKGYSQWYIGALVTRPLKTVSRIIQAYKYEGRIHDAPRAPSPKATTDDEDALIVPAAVRNPFLPAPAIREDLDVSDTTFRRRLRTAGLRSHVAAEKPLLTAANKDARRRFAKLHESWTAEEWGRVIFSDESTFSTRQDQRLRVWRLPGTRSDLDNVQSVSASGRSSVSVWCAVSKYGLRPLQRIRGHLSSEQYCNILNNVLLPYASSLFPDGNYLFQQDRSPIHTARVVKEFQAEQHIQLLEWPPKGADLNVFENVWGHLKAALARKPLYSGSSDQLWAQVNNEWNRLKTYRGYVQSLYDSLPSKIAAVVAVSGNMTRY